MLVVGEEHTALLPVEFTPSEMQSKVTLNPQLLKVCSVFCCQAFCSQVHAKNFLVAKSISGSEEEDKLLQLDLLNCHKYLQVITATSDTDCLGLQADSHSL